MKIACVLLDMGGVLLEMGNAAGLPQGKLDWRGREALLREARRRGGTLELEDLERLLFGPWRRGYERRYELGREESWHPHLRRLRRVAGFRAHDVTLLRTWFRPYGELLSPLPGARPALAELVARGLRLGVVSNVPLPGRLYRRVLARHGLASGFGSFQFSYDAASRKPSPVMIRAALAELGDVAPEWAVMVGDRQRSDIAAGRSAGVHTVLLGSADPADPLPDASLGGLAELPRWLDGFAT